MEEVIHSVGNALFFASAAICWIFMYLYHRWAYWWRHEVGVHIMAFVASQAAVLTLGILKLVFGDSLWFQVVRTLVFITYPGVLTWRLALLVRLRRHRVSQGHNDRA